MTTPMPDITDNPHAPDVFADAATGWYILNGTIRITFESARAVHTNPPGPPVRMVIGRLVMPVGQAEAMAKGLLDFIAQQRALADANAQGAPPTALN